MGIVPLDVALSCSNGSALCVCSELLADSADHLISWYPSDYTPVWDGAPLMGDVTKDRLVV